MPYALSNLIDGQVPSYRYVNLPTDALPGEVVVADADFRDGWVWDAANKRLRPRTDAEVLARAKRDKRAEFEDRGASDMQGVMPVYRALLLLARNSTDPRFANLRAVDDRLSQKQAAVDAATTLEGVGAVKWEA